MPCLNRLGSKLPSYSIRLSSDLLYVERDVKTLLTRWSCNNMFDLHCLHVEWFKSDSVEILWLVKIILIIFIDEKCSLYLVKEMRMQMFNVLSKTVWSQFSLLHEPN